MRTSLAAIATCLVSGAALAQSLNEIRTQQPGVNLQNYVEISGTPGASLTGLTFLIIGHDPFLLPPEQNGVIERAISLDGYSVPSSGFFVMAPATYTITTPNLVADLGFQTDNNRTYMLVQGFFGVEGDNIDLTHDGVIDNALWTSVVSDVALLASATTDGSAAGDFVYSSNRVGPDGGVFPSHVRKCPDSAAWQIGFADPAAGGDTPGAANPACGTGSGVVLINEIRIDQAGVDNDEYVELAGQPGASLNGLTFVVLGDATTPKSGTVETLVPLDGQVIPASGVFLITLKNTTQDGIAFGKAGDLQTAALNLENSQNSTFLLVRGYSGSTVVNAATSTDIDTNDDGTPDGTMPWTEVLDAVAIRNNAATIDIAAGAIWPYSFPLAGGVASPVVQLDDVFPPAHIYRCAPQGSWSIGYYDPTAAGSDNRDTPAVANPECEACGGPGSGSCFVAHGTPGCDKSGCCSTVCGLIPSCCDVTWDATCASGALQQCLTAGSPPSVQFSELRVRDSAGGGKNRYVELNGSAGASLNGVTLVGIGRQVTGGTDAAGFIRMALPLDGQQVNTSGSLLIANASFSVAGALADFTPSSGFSTDSSATMTYMLVWNFYGTVNTDLDTDNNGTFDSTPWTSVIDSVAIVGTTGTAYGTTVVGPSGTSNPAQAFRCTPEGTWSMGPELVTSVFDTPGAANTACASAGTFTCGDANAGDCFTAHNNAHCSDLACCDAVCAVKPECCSTLWDANCVSQTAFTVACGGSITNTVLISQVYGGGGGTSTTSPGTYKRDYIELFNASSAPMNIGGWALEYGSATGTWGSSSGNILVFPANTVIESCSYLLVANGTPAANVTGGELPVTPDITWAAALSATNCKVALFTATNSNKACGTELAGTLVDKVSYGSANCFEGTAATGVLSVTKGAVRKDSGRQDTNDNLADFDVVTAPVPHNKASGAISGCSVVNNCPGDLDGSLAVDAGDIGSLLILFGDCPNATPGCLGDLDNSGSVDAGDIGSLLILFGDCPV